MVAPMCVLYGDLSVLKRTSRLGRNTLPSPNSGANSARIAFIGVERRLSRRRLYGRSSRPWSCRLRDLRRTPGPRQASRGTSSCPCSSVGVDPVWADEHGGSAFLGHGSVVGVPVVVLAAGSGEDLSEQQAESFGVEPGLGIVRPGQLGVSFDCCPLPAVAERGGHLGPGAQVGELYRAVGDERQSGLASGWVRDDARVDEG